MELDLDLNGLKKAHDYYVTVVQILTQRVQFYAEEFVGIVEIIDFNKSMALKIKAKIEEMEGPSVEGSEEKN